MYESFDLVLMVNHACNLRCSYCYTGAKYWRSMTAEVALASVDRAVNSIRPGGVLELGFFGGEPLLEAALIRRIVDYAASKVRSADLSLEPSLTTNGTLDRGDAWRVLTMPEMHVTVSHDGLPRVHNKHRIRGDVRGDTPPRGSAHQVVETMQSLISFGKPVRASMVVRPDTVAWLPEGIAWLREQGVNHADPTLDLWTKWSSSDAEALVGAVTRCAILWRDGLPDCSIGWFDKKAARLANIQVIARRDAVTVMARSRSRHQAGCTHVNE
jgi:uncharacterized protein